MKLLAITLISFFILGNNNPQDKQVKKELNLKFINSYYLNKPNDVIEYCKIVQDSLNIYYIKGEIVFDNERNTIQKITKKKTINENQINKITDKLKQNGYRSNFDNNKKVMYLQLRLKNKSDISLLDLAQSISDKIDQAMMINNLGLSYGLTIDNGVANMEFEVNNWDKALQMTLEIINNNKLLDNFIIGKRLYLSEDDYNYEIVYPIDFSDSFYPY